MGCNRIFIADENCEKRRVNKVFVRGPVAVDLYVSEDPQKEAIDITDTFEALQCINGCRIKFSFATTDEDVGLLVLDDEETSYNMLLSLYNGKIKISARDTDLNTVIGTSVATYNDGLLHTIELVNTLTGHAFYVDDVELADFVYTSEDGTSVINLDNPWTLVAIGYNYTELDYQFLIKDLVVSNIDSTPLIILPFNEGHGSWVIERLSGSIGTILAPEWVLTPPAAGWKEANKVLVCNEAGVWKRAH